MSRSVLTHIVLFRPKAGLSAGERAALAAALEAALREIPSIRRVRLGRRVRHGRPGYEQLMTKDFAYAALLEFDDQAGLEAYLAHPAHQLLADRFFASFEEALMYDYQMQDGGAPIDALA